MVVRDGHQACLAGLLPLAMGIQGLFPWPQPLLLTAASLSPAVSSRPWEPLQPCREALKQRQEVVGEDSPPAWEPSGSWAGQMIKMVSFLHLFGEPSEVSCCAFSCCAFSNLP